MSAEPFDLLKAVVDPVRLAVLGASAEGPVSINELAERLDVRPRKVAEAVGQLRAMGFLDEDAVLDRDALQTVARQIPSTEQRTPANVVGPWTPEEAQILAKFFSGDRLEKVPSSAQKRRLVLEKIAQSFEPGRRYDERDVNFMIQLIYHDYAAIRRYMVDEGFMDRADGAYWRIGGRYDLPDESEKIEETRTIPTSIDGVELRAYSPTMVTALLEAANDERIPRYMGDQFPYPYTLRAAEEWVELATVGPNAANQFAIFVDGALAGGCGAFVMQAENTGSAEIGWWLNPAHWGKGITTACVIALIDELFENHELMRLFAPVMSPNGASAAVALKAGMRAEGVAESAYLKNGVRYDQVNHGITRAQWQAHRAERPT